MSETDLRLSPLFKVIRWIIHFLIIIAIILFFEFIQAKYSFSRFVRAPFPLLREHWLPIFITFLYLNIWAVWAFWHSLSLKSKYSPFHSIQVKIENGIQYTNSREVDIKTTPIFLVLGQPISGSSHLFKLYTQSLDNFAWRESIFLPSNDGIFINLDEDSHLGNVEGRIVQNYESEWKKLFYINTHTDETIRQKFSSKAQVDPIESSEIKKITDSPSLEMPASAMIQEALQDAQNQLAKIFSPPQEIPLEVASSPNPESINDLFENKESQDSLSIHITKDSQEKPDTAQNLNYLLEKIQEFRFPITPINGIALVIPLPFLTETNIPEIIKASNKDLLFIRKKLELNCPVHVIFTDIDKLPGYAAFFRNNIQSKIREHFGINYPSCFENLGTVEIQEKIKTSVSWVITEWFPKTMYSFLDFSKSGKVPNLGFLELMSSFWKLESNISLLTAKLLAPNNTMPFLAGSCHFIATGSNSNTQAFYQSTFRKMIEMQNCLTWQKNVFRKDRALLFLTIIGYIFLVGIIVLAIYFAWAVILK